jgi:hypothetical protein
MLFHVNLLVFIYSIYKLYFLIANNTPYPVTIYVGECVNTFQALCQMLFKSKINRLLLVLSKGCSSFLIVLEMIIMLSMYLKLVERLPFNTHRKNGALAIYFGNFKVTNKHADQRYVFFGKNWQYK